VVWRGVACCVVCCCWEEEYRMIATRKSPARGAELQAGWMGGGVKLQVDGHSPIT
jgi:hypothetical protein